MNITSEYETMVFRNEYNGKTFYSLGLSKKDKEGNYTNGYIKAVFKKDVDIPNKTKIKNIKGKLDFYLKDKQTIPYIFVFEYELVENNPYEEFGKETGNLPW